MNIPLTPTTVRTLFVVFVTGVLFGASTATLGFMIGAGILLGGTP